MGRPNGRRLLCGLRMLYGPPVVPVGGRAGREVGKTVKNNIGAYIKAHRPKVRTEKRRKPKGGKS